MPGVFRPAHVDTHHLKGRQFFPENSADFFDTAPEAPAGALTGTRHFCTIRVSDSGRFPQMKKTEYCIVSLYMDRINDREEDSHETSDRSSDNPSAASRSRDCPGSV